MNVKPEEGSEWGVLRGESFVSCTCLCSDLVDIAWELEKRFTRRVSGWSSPEDGMIRRLPKTGDSGRSRRGAPPMCGDSERTGVVNLNCALGRWFGTGVLGVLLRPV